ncbi:MAG: hypothetical protein AABZ31_12620 [Bdellovibrionota bacterium]
MKQLRIKSIFLAISIGLVCAQSDAAVIESCQVFLSKVSVRAQALLHSISEVPLSDESDYQAEAFQNLGLSDRYIHTYSRIQNRHHKSYKTMFFYDYEVRDVIAKMKSTLLDAYDYSLAKTPAQQTHARALAALQKDIGKYESLKRVPYYEFHETTLNFAAFIKKGLKTNTTFKIKPQGRYSRSGYEFTIRNIQGSLNTSGFVDLDREISWVLLRSKLLRRGPDAIFIPTFEELDEDFFNGISSYPVFPVGMTTNTNIIVDGQLFGSILFLLHDFYHAEKSLRSIVYTPEAIAAREQRRLAFNSAVATVEDIHLNRIIRVLFHFITHEEKGSRLTNETIVLSHSRHMVRSLNIDGNTFEDIQMRIYARPYDFGELFGDNLPEITELFKARQWLVDFLRKDTYYP